MSELKHDTSPPLRDIPPAEALPKNSEREQGRRAPTVPGLEDLDSVVQSGWGLIAMPAPILNFDGIVFATSSCNCAPPDTNGDIGPNHYVQIVNTAYQVFNKTTGASVFGPVANNTLWAGFGGPCQLRNDGDPIVKYDQLADRWVINQFTSAPPFTQCIAVSQTGDPMGAYYRYAFPQFDSLNRFGDYQKIGVWPDAYYMSNNEFNASFTAFLGAGNYAFDRTRMLAGLSASYVYFGLPATNWGGQQPSDWDGSNPPPVGAPNLFVEIDDAAWDPSNIPTDQLQMWRFHVDFVVPAASTFTALPKIVPPALAPFDGLLCNFSPCVPQLGTTSRLDTLADRVMYRVAYRNFGTHESIVFNHTVDAGTDKSAIRWYELRGINATPSIFQQGTYDPDTNHHWMGSIAQDNQGNMALGYSVSSSTMNPAIRYGGRLVGDPLGTLPQAEGTLINGTGSQIGTNGRWGDYSSMNVDPVDDCTFWYTQEYYSVTATFTWRTRIGKFRFAQCGIPGTVIEPAGSTLVNESCPPANGFIDPGETATVNLKLMNSGTAATTNLVATLQPNANVLAPSGPQNYGAIAPGAMAGRDFTFTADGTCGDTITLTLQLQDGANNLGTVSYMFVLGCNTACAGAPRISTSTVLSCSGSNKVATITICNSGTATANNVMLTTAKLGGVDGTPLPQSVGTLAPGACATRTVTFTGAPSGMTTLQVGGTYTGGTYNSNRKVNAPVCTTPPLSLAAPFMSLPALLAMAAKKA